MSAAIRELFHASIIVIRQIFDAGTAVPGKFW
jgi:hypothetical protein